MKYIIFHVCGRKSLSTKYQSVLQVENLTLKIEQETQKRCLIQNDFKMQTQQLNALKVSEKQIKQENNHLIEIKLSLEKQNNELRK